MASSLLIWLAAVPPLLAPPQVVPHDLVRGCPVAEASRPSELSSRLKPPVLASSASPQAPVSPAADYRHRLMVTSAGWPRMDHWCVWVEPSLEKGAGARWDRLWLEAVDAALARWGELLPIQRVRDPAAAQVRILRRRPPLRFGADGRSRASHGRASLRLMEVLRNEVWWLEPHVDVLISPGQRAQATEATALHELGHAFGLWGHSNEKADAMAGVPGPRPVLELTARDRATLRWLYAQPTPFGRPLHTIRD
jgi:hypothetical protein